MNQQGFRFLLWQPVVGDTDVMGRPVDAVRTFTIAEMTTPIHTPSLGEVRVELVRPLFAQPGNLAIT